MNEENHISEDMKALEPLKDAPIAPAHGIAALALNMALKYHDMGMIKDGALYQQYKLEGRNIETIHLEMVFETAIKMEAFLLGASERIAKIVVDAIEIAVTEDESTEGHKDGEAEDSGAEKK
jgi:hypothetical protein